MKPRGKKTVEAHASMSGYSSNVKPYGGIHLRITDASSGIMVMEVSFTYEQMGQMVAGHGETICEMELFDSFEVTGKVHQNKVEKVQINRRGGLAQGETLAKLQKEAKKLEEDGWVAEIPLTFNSHRYDHGSGEYSIVYRRYFDKEDSND